jgi:hypothetical protein
LQHVQVKESGHAKLGRSKRRGESGSGQDGEEAAAEEETEGTGKDTAGKEKEPKARKVSAKCWLAANFPLKVQQLLPLMDLMSHANKHFAKVRRAQFVLP